MCSVQPGLCSRNPASPSWLLTVKAERGTERHSHSRSGVAIVRLLLALRFFSKVFLTQECDRGGDVTICRVELSGPTLQGSWPVRWAERIARTLVFPPCSCLCSPIVLFLKNMWRSGPLCILILVLHYVSGTGVFSSLHLSGSGRREHSQAWRAAVQLWSGR